MTKTNLLKISTKNRKENYDRIIWLYSRYKDAIEYRKKKRQDKVITILFSRTVSKAEMRGLKDTEYWLKSDCLK